MPCCEIFQVPSSTTYQKFSLWIRGKAHPFISAKKAMNIGTVYEQA